VDDEPPPSVVELEPPLDESPFEDSLDVSELVALSDPPFEPLPTVAPSRAAFRDAAPRSFFAQPLPLKWIVGGANALRTGPLWQTGQCVGPGAFNPWMTSNRCPQ
jgi:hypothetical protein